MRGSTALLVTGAVMIVVATTAPVLAADDPVRVAPASEQVVPADGAADGPAAPPSVAADQSAADPRPAPGAVEADEVAAEEKAESPRRGDMGRREGDEPKQPLADVSVTMRDIQFHPKTLEISPGDRVTWTNRDTAQHNAVDRGSFETRLLEEGESDSVTIDSAGTYNYICTVHPDMKGKLIAGSGGDSGGDSGTGNSSGGGTASSSGGDTSALGGGGSSSSSSGGSSGSLPSTGQEQLPLLILGAALIVAGLLTRAFHEYWIWR